MEINMENPAGMIIMIAACIAVLLIGALKRKAEWLLNGCLRAVLGVIAIYFVNSFLEKQGIDTCVGINAITVLTSAILGFPGVAALYGLGFYRLL